MLSGIVFADVATKPNYAHVGAWRDDDGRITVAYLGTFPKQTILHGVEVGAVQLTPEALANALLHELVREAGS